MWVLAFASPAAGQPQLLMPGVTYERQVQFTAAGPVVLHVLTAPRPGGLWSLEPVLANDTVAGLERLTEMERRLSGSATTAGVNGGRFAADGRPSGILIRHGVLDHPPIPARASIGIDSTGTVRVQRVALLATWQGTGPRRSLSVVNDRLGASGVALYTPAWGPATPPAPGSVEAVLQPFPPAAPTGGELTGRVTQVASGGGTPIPADGAVLVARGSPGGRLQAEAPVGREVRVRLLLRPNWGDVAHALGGGPVLVRDGRAVVSAGEAFTVAELATRQPRTAVGQAADGRILLVAADGRSLGYSGGLTTFDLALAMLRLGAVTAAALDGGGSTAMAFDGRLLNRPADQAGERPIATGLLVLYRGVQAPPPAEPVLSPNGDGVGERQLLAYKVVRPSTVTATLTGPTGAVHTVFSGLVEPGTYSLEWTGRGEDGSPQPEGRWLWSVTASDDLGRVSSVERAFSLNLTLGFPRAVGSPLTVPRRTARPVAAFELARPARVTVRIETVSGALVRTLGRRSVPVGTLTVSWDGVAETGGVVYSGRYLARVVAVNELGSVALAVPFTVRRAGPPAGARR